MLLALSSRACETWWHVFPQLVFSERCPDLCFGIGAPVIEERACRRPLISTEEELNTKKFFDKTKVISRDQLR